jgi:hypothetical protein
VTLEQGVPGAAAESPGPAELRIALERPLPTELPAGTGTALFVLGSCAHPRERLTGLDVLVDDIARPATAFAMPRPDLTDARSGFWATVPIAGRHAPATIELALAARLESGATARAPLGSITVVPPAPPPATRAQPAQAGGELIAICMATFEPDPALFAAQVTSLREQTDQRWICLVSDDASRPEHVEHIRTVLGDDSRFAFSRSDERLGLYRNFERAMGMVPAEAPLVALCDQDDRWHPDKLATLRAALDDAVLVFSDQRLVDADGRVLHDTLWRGRRVNATNLVSELVANTVTGAATLFRRELADLALPFPDSPGFQFHDHWLGVVAMAAGDVAYVERPLYDYVQHAGAVFGDVTRGEGPGRLPRWRGARDVLARWRAAYFYGYLAREVQAQAALMRCGSRLTPARRRALVRFVAADRSTSSLIWLTVRSLRTLAGRTETLGSEIELARGILWRRLTVALGRRGDASFPPPGSFNQRRLRRWRASLG